jgi:hypothetical protein
MARETKEQREMRFGWFFALPLLVVALLAGSCGYAMGVGSSAVAPVATAPAVYPMWGFGWFFPVFGFIFFLIVIGLIFGAFKRGAWGGRGGYGAGRGWYGPGRGGRGYGPGGWYKPGSDDAFDQWHRRMHGEPDQPATGDPDQPAGPDSTGGEPTNAPWSPPTPPKDK